MYSDIRFLAPAVLAQPGALEVVSMSESVSESVRSNFLGAHAPLEIAPVSESVSESVSQSDYNS